MRMISRPEDKEKAEVGDFYADEKGVLYIFDGKDFIELRPACDDEEWWLEYEYKENGEKNYLIPNYKIERFKEKIEQLNKTIYILQDELRRVVNKSCWD
jgi:hypothetical protein